MSAVTGEALIDEWFATDGVSAAGPMRFLHLAGDVARGRLGPGAFVRHASWSIWQRFEQLDALSEDERRSTVSRLAGISASASDRARDPTSVPPPPLSERVRTRGRMPSAVSARRPNAVNPVAVLARASSFDAALQLALSTALAASRADAGLAHAYRRDLDRLVTVHAIGDGAESQLGNRLSPDDPSVASARNGATVVAEPHPGSAGRHVAGRFAPILHDVAGTAMVPVAAFGKLHAMIEVGRSGSPFYAREVARIEDIVEALAARGVVTGWLV